MRQPARETVQAGVAHTVGTHPRTLLTVRAWVRVRYRVSSVVPTAKARIVRQSAKAYVPRMAVAKTQEVPAAAWVASECQGNNAENVARRSSGWHATENSVPRYAAEKSARMRS